MTTNNGKNFVDSILEAQKNMVNTFVENRKKVTNGNTVIADTLEKNTEAYNKWMDEQKETLAQATQKVENVQESAKENASKANDFFQNWLNLQVNWTKQAWEMNQDFLKKNAKTQTESLKNGNPFDWFQNMNTQWNNWLNQANQTNQWLNLMQQFSPASLSDNLKKSAENVNGIFNQYNELLQNSFQELQKNMQNATTQDAYQNMTNVASGFSKFYEMWAPFWKSIQEKTFQADQFKNFANLGTYKEMMDKFFGFVPEDGRAYLDQAKAWYEDGVKRFGQMGYEQFQNGKNLWEGLTSGSGGRLFQNVLEGYQKMQSGLQSAISPIAKMAGPNAFTKNAAVWADISDRMAVFQIKNAEMQYLMYQQGSKVLDKLVSDTAEKVAKGEKIESITDLYKNWLHISDEVYVSLFESDEYSSLLAEVSAMQLKLKKDIELQLEQSLSGIPVATRSELDELYKVIYDLKKQVRQLEKMLELDETAPVKETPARGRKTTTASATSAKK